METNINNAKEDIIKENTVEEDTVKENDVKYIVNDNDIKLLLKQVNVDYGIAKKLLEDNEGDLLNSTLDALKLQDASLEKIINNNILESNSNNNNISISKEELESKEKIIEFRNILDEKDAIFQESVSNKIDITDTKLFNYIPFTYNTTIYKKDTVNSTRNIMLREITRDYLTEEINKLDEDILLELELNDTSNLKLVNKYLGKDSKKMYKRWGLNKPGIFYLINQILEISKYSDKDIEKYKTYENKIATRLLIKSGHLKTSEFLIGPCMIIDEWF